MKHVMIAVVILSGLAVSPCAVAAQPWSPPPRMNLKVLPESTDDRTLIATMRRFAQGLGVRCQHCHIYKGDNPDDLSTFDFASDEKAPKLTARAMMRMVRTINDDHLKDVGEVKPAGEVKVTCYTCHRGEKLPATRRPDR